MRALLDTDVILDLILERTPFVADAEALVDAHEQGLFAAYIALSRRLTSIILWARSRVR